MAPFRWWRGLAGALVAAAVLWTAGSAHALESRPQGIAPKPPVPTGVVVNIPARTLYWYVDGQVVRSFPVGVGKTSSETPVGSYRVQNKAKHPWWQPPWGGPAVAPGPANPLGTRWIGFSGGYGIHGNNNPDSIGHLVSLGCVRMYIPDVEWLYDQVSVGTPVRVIYEPVQMQYGPDGERYLAIYPDVYGNGAPSISNVLRAAGTEADAVPAAAEPGLYALDARGAVNGQDLPAILHQGKPYLPARQLGALLNAAVGWDAMTRTASLDGHVLPTVIRDGAGYVDAAAAAAALRAEHSWDVKSGSVAVTGNPVFLNGEFLGRFAIMVEGQPYLPVRQAGEALGAVIGWDSALRQATVNGQPIATLLRGSRSYATPEALGQLLSLQARTESGVVYLTE